MAGGQIKIIYPDDPNALPSLTKQLAIQHSCLRLFHMDYNTVHSCRQLNFRGTAVCQLSRPQS
jgi:hypothetical protein